MLSVRRPRCCERRIPVGPTRPRNRRQLASPRVLGGPLADGTGRRDFASSLVSLASERSLANTAPENRFIHLDLWRVAALPCRAAVLRKPMCRQALGGAAVPPASILLLPAALSEIPKFRNVATSLRRAYRDGQSESHLPDRYRCWPSVAREQHQGSRVGPGLVVGSAFIDLKACTTTTERAAGGASDETGDEAASILSMVRRTRATYSSITRGAVVRRG